MTHFSAESRFLNRNIGWKQSMIMIASTLTPLESANLLILLTALVLSNGEWMPKMVVLMLGGWKHGLLTNLPRELLMEYLDLLPGRIPKMPLDLFLLGRV